MNIIKKIVLPLAAAAAMFANNVQADPPPPYSTNLVTDDAALNTWENSDFGPPQAELIYDLPLTEVTSRLTRIYTNKFDIILPSALPAAFPGNPAAGAVPMTDPSSIQVKLELRNVKPIEIFNAMNLYWETTGTPVHWKLTLNGSRPTAILVANQPPPDPAPAPRAEMKASVFSIADILKSPGDMKHPEDIALNIAAVLEETAHQPPGSVVVTREDYLSNIRIHEQAGLLVFTGTPEQTELVRSTLEAMKQTVQVRYVEDVLKNITNSASGSLKK